MITEKIRELESLNWHNLDAQELEQLMVLSMYSAREFAGSLRIALRLHPGNEMLKEMARGELKTDNLQYEDFTRKADHDGFLEYFLDKYGVLQDTPKEVIESAKTYLQRVAELGDKVRAMSIFSREVELPKIFGKILKAKDWNTAALGAYKYFLERHIELDTEDGGHADLVGEMPIDDRVNAFYVARVELYRPIGKLFEN